jgi:hypothetical protein
MKLQTGVDMMLQLRTARNKKHGSLVKGFYIHTIIKRD